MDKGERIKAKQENLRFPFLYSFIPLSLIPYPLSFVSLLLLAVCLSACSPTYVLRAGYEEAKILWHRRPIAEVLARSDLDPATREKLTMVLRVCQFVEQDLGFKTG